jgi:hypothetical protein
MDKQESVVSNYNCILRNRTLKYYYKLQKHKYDLDKFRRGINREAENLKNFKNMAIELKTKEKFIKFQGKFGKAG